MRFDKTPKHGVILIRPERNLYYDSNQDKVQHWHQSPALHHHWYYLHLNVSILVPVSLYRRIRWPQIRVSTLSPAVSLCPSTQRSPGWSVPSSSTIVAGVSLVKVSLCWCPMKCGAPAHPQQPWDWLSLSWLTAVSVAVWDDDWGNFNRESLCNTIVDSLYPVSTQHSSLSTQLHHRHSNGISGHCQQCWVFRKSVSCCWYCQCEHNCCLSCVAACQSGDRPISCPYLTPETEGAISLYSSLYLYIFL